MLARQTLNHAIFALCLLSRIYMKRTDIGRPSQQRRVFLRRRNTVVRGKCALPSALLVAPLSSLSNLHETCCLMHIAIKQHSKISCEKKITFR